MNFSKLKSRNLTSTTADNLNKTNRNTKYSQSEFFGYRKCAWNSNSNNSSYRTTLNSLDNVNNNATHFNNAPSTNDTNLLTKQPKRSTHFYGFRDINPAQPYNNKKSLDNSIYIPESKNDHLEVYDCRLIESKNNIDEDVNMGNISTDKNNTYDFNVNLENDSQDEHCFTVECLIPESKNDNNYSQSKYNSFNIQFINDTPVCKSIYGDLDEELTFDSSSNIILISTPELTKPSVLVKQISGVKSEKHVKINENLFEITTSLDLASVTDSIDSSENTIEETQNNCNSNDILSEPPLPLPPNQLSPKTKEYLNKVNLLNSLNILSKDTNSETHFNNDTKRQGFFNVIKCIKENC